MTSGPLIVFEELESWSLIRLFGSLEPFYAFQMFFGGFTDPRRLDSLEPLDLKMIGPHRSGRIESLLGTLGSLREYK